MNQSEERYSRQIRFGPIGLAGQRKLAEKRVLIVGVGALGTVLANHMVRAGVGYVRLVDRDYVEISNLQRQLLFDETDAREGLPKAVAAERKLRSINSEVRAEGIVSDFTSENAHELTQDIDLVLDGTDNFQTRFLLNDICFERGIPFVYGGAVSARGMTAAFIPGRTACLHCMIGPGAGTGETCDTVGVISMAIDAVASYQAVEALKLLTGAEGSLRDGMLMLDMWNYHTHLVKLPKPKPECPTCGTKQYPFLYSEEERDAAVLCGRDTVQLRLGYRLTLQEWRQRLEGIAEIDMNPFLLKAQLPEGERFVLFPDGRVLVQGTSDPVRAKTLSARYLGS